MEQQDTAWFNRAVSDMEFIPLATSPDGLFRQIMQADVDSQYVYILGYNHGPIHLFDKKNGQLVQRLGRIGRGPGECLQFTDFLVQKNRVLVPAWYPRKEILSFTKQGEVSMLREMQIPFNRVMEIDSNTYAINIGNGGFPENDSHALRLLDTNFQVKHMLLPKNEKRDKFGAGTNKFCQYAGQTFFLPELCDTIYQVHSDHTTPVYRLDFATYWPPSGFIEQFVKRGNIIEFVEQMHEENYVSFIDNYVNDRYVFLKYFLQADYEKQAEPHLAIYSKRDKTTYNLCASKTPMIALFKEMIAMDGEVLVCLVDAHVLIQLAQQVAADPTLMPTPQLAEKLVQTAQKLQETDNPVVVRLSLD